MYVGPFARRPLGGPASAFPARTVLGSTQVQRLGLHDYEPLVSSTTSHRTAASGCSGPRALGKASGQSTPPLPTTGRLGLRLDRFHDLGPGHPPASGVRRPVDLLATRVGRDHELVQPGTTPAAAGPASKTPWTGISRTNARVRAVTSPTRSPVNGPGPTTQMVIAVRSAALAPASASTSWMPGANISPWRIDSSDAGPHNRVTVMQVANVICGVAVSKASSTCRA